MRRTGRTTKILLNMVKSPFDMVIFVAANHQMSKYHMDMFVELLNKHPAFPEIKVKVNYTKRQVYAFGKVFEFIGQEFLNQNCRNHHYRGVPAFDIYRDHTCYEY